MPNGGAFRVARIDGRWPLVDPDGRRYGRSARSERARRAADAYRLLTDLTGTFPAHPGLLDASVPHTLLDEGRSCADKVSDSADTRADCCPRPTDARAAVAGQPESAPGVGWTGSVQPRRSPPRVRRTCRCLANEIR